MADYEFLQLDVFTEQPLSGNALAVFPDAEGLDVDTMQRIAREMNLSETTFVTPSSKATKRVRFFTPMAELPLAGHPTVGTWWSLCELGVIEIPADGCEVTQETGAGVLPVRIDGSGSTPKRVTMTQAQPSWHATVTDRSALAAELGTTAVNLADPDPQVVSTGVQQMMIPFTSHEALRALPVGGTGAGLAALLRTYDTDCAMCFYLDGDVAHCRMFAPGLGVPEDPATGSASGALGAYIVHHQLMGDRPDTTELTVSQGVEIDRPSTIHVSVDWNGDAISSVRVGGTAVTIIRGTLSL